MNERQGLIAAVGATVCGVILVTCALLPTTPNGASADELLFLSVPATAGLAGFLGWAAMKAATAAPAWVVSLWVVAAWGVLVGALCLFSNISAWNHNAKMLQSSIEITEGYRTGSADSKGDMPDDYVKEQIFEGQQDEQEYREKVSQSKRSVLGSAAMVALGLAAGWKARQLKRMRSAAVA